MLAQPYLNFDGRCEEALDFYRRTLDAEVTALMRFKDNPEVCASGMVPPGAEGKVMHSSFRIGDSTLMASDSGCGGQPNFEGVSLALTTANDDDAKRRFTARVGADASVEMAGKQGSIHQIGAAAQGVAVQRGDDRLGQPVPHVRLPPHPRRPQVADSQPRHRRR